MWSPFPALSTSEGTDWVPSWQYWTQCLVLARQALYHLNDSASPFFVGYFQDRVSQTICPGWLWTIVLLISASWVARIMGVNHRCLAQKLFHWQLL
jgi:hypothetical protein